MGYSINRYPYAGSNEFDLNFTLGYINRSDVFAYVQDELDTQGSQIFRDITWLDNNRVRVSGTFSTGDTVVLQRVVSKQSLVIDFETEGTATRQALNTGFKQAIMAVHELYDGALADTALVSATPEEVENALRFISQHSAAILGVAELTGTSLDTVANVLSNVQFEDFEDAVAKTTAAQISAIAARDAAEDAVQYNYLVNTDADRVALTGMLANERSYVRDTQHVWKYDGVTWVDEGLSVTYLKADKETLIAPVQALGAPDEDMDAGTGATGGGTYCYGTPLNHSGTGFTFTCYALNAGSIDIRVLSRAGTTFTVVASETVTMQAGLNTFVLDEVEYVAGQYLGFTVFSNKLAIAPGTDGYYGDPGAIVNIGESFTDTVESFVQFKARFDMVQQTVTGTNMNAVINSTTDLNRVVGITSESLNVGRGENSSLETGSGVGASYYIFEEAALYESTLSTFSLWATVAGTIQLQAWSFDEVGDVLLERVLDLPVSVGLNTFTNLPFEIKPNEHFGLWRGTGNIALNSAGGEPTPYRSVGSTSGTPSGVNASLRFEFKAKFTSKNVLSRLSALENDDAGFTVSPYSYHALWLLGESHVAGRSTVLSNASVPAGSGYKYVRATNTMQHLVDPTGNDSTAIAGAGRGSFGPQAGKTLLDISNGVVGAAIINSGRGSSTIGNHWADGGAGWSDALSDLAGAKTHMRTLRKALCGASVLIAIGSNDAAAGTTKANFKAGYLDLISRVRTTLGYNVPILVVLTAPFRDGTYATEVAYIQEAQHEIVKETTNCRMVTTVTEYASELNWFMDTVHLNQTANDVIGANLATVAFSIGSGNSLE